MFTVQLPSLIKEGWEHSKLKDLPNQTPQFKGSLGSTITQQLIPGSVIVSDQGDLDMPCGNRSEVKTALWNTKTKSLWWNQIRPSQTGWTVLHLVAIYPDSIEVYEFTRSESEAMFKDKQLCKSGHIGTDDLLEIKAVNNSKRNTVNLLTNYGTLICKTNLDQVKVESV